MVFSITEKYVCDFTALTAAPINLIFGMHNHIRCRSVIGYMILTFDVTKCHFKSNKILCQVPESSLRMIYVNFHKPICPLWPFKNFYAAVTAHNSYSSSSSSRSSSSRSSSSSSIAGERHSLRALKHRPRCLAWPEGPASLFCHKFDIYIYIYIYIFFYFHSHVGTTSLLSIIYSSC